jgi:hypothetical protein
MHIKQILFVHQSENNKIISEEAKLCTEAIYKI